MAGIPKSVRWAFAVSLIAALGAMAVVGAIWTMGAMAGCVADAWADAYVLENVDALPSVDAAIVLGTAPYGVRGQRYRTLSHRLEAAADLWSSGKVKYLIVSGNRIGTVYDEPTTMRDGLVALGVPAAFIYRDFGGFRTWESIVRARDIYGQRRVIIVSERDHLARALLIAGHVGLEAWGYAASGTTYAGWRGRFVGNLAILDAYYDIVTDGHRRDGRPVSIGVDPPP